MTYRQITSEQRYMLAALRMQGLRPSQIARELGCHRSTIGRELRRNCSVSDGRYRASKAQELTNGRRSRSRRNQQFTLPELEHVNDLLRQRWSPEQISGRLARGSMLSISHESREPVDRSTPIFDAPRSAVARGMATMTSRGRLAGKRHISERPLSAETRQRLGHWEIDTVMGKGSRDCILSLVERKTGLLIIGKLPSRTTESLNARAIKIIQADSESFNTITADNGTEFHNYAAIEKRTCATFYFASPYHSWERGTNENTNGLIRQYLPKGTSMAGLTQRQCNAIAISGRAYGRVNLIAKIGKGFEYSFGKLSPRSATPSRWLGHGRVVPFDIFGQ